MKITQIEPSTVQTAREGNKRRTYVNVQMQTAEAIVTRILSELLADGEEREEGERGGEEEDEEESADEYNATIRIGSRRLEREKSHAERDEIANVVE